MKHIYKQLEKIQVFIAVFILALSSLSFIALLPQASAANLTNDTIVELGGAAGANPMIAADGQAMAFEFDSPTGGATSMTINMGSGTALAAPVYATGDGSNSCTTLFGAGVVNPSGTPSATGSGSTFTISSMTALTASTKYCFFLTANTAFTNPAAGVYTATITAGSDSQTAAYDVLSSGANAITVSGTVAPTFTLSLGTNTDALGTLSSTTVTTSSPGVTSTVKTNAPTGWFVYAEDSNTGLKSTLNGHTIASVPVNAAFNFGTHTGSEEYGLSVTDLTNTTVPAAYTAGSNNGAGLVPGTYYQIASSTTPPSTSATFTTNELADIASNTPAGTDYSDVITLVGSGSF
jgi:hypothetical protein